MAWSPSFGLSYAQFQPEREKPVSDITGPATARLREAGAMLPGKTTTPEFGCKGEFNSPLTGLTRNPWNSDKTPGGSSGGTAAAVAAGLGSIGTDGSGRIPAAFCDNFGLKPSFGPVPADPLSPFGSVAHLGPHTMSVTGAALMMNVLKQPDSRDWTSLSPDRTDYTIGLWFVSSTVVWDTLTPAQHALADPDFVAEVELGRAYTTLDVQKPTLQRGALGTHMRQFMQRYDLLVTPSIAVPAFDAKPAGHRVLTPENMLGWTPFSDPFNLTQQPACPIPCGLTADGLPMGSQIVGPMFGDALVLRAARAYEAVCPIPRPALV